MKRVLLSLLFATLAGALVFGAAANLPVDAQDLGAGVDPVISCDPTDGVDVTFTWDNADPTTITAIDVSDIHADCDELTIYISVLSDGDGSIYDATHVYDIDVDLAGTVTFGSLTLDATEIDDVAVTIAG